MQAYVVISVIMAISPVLCAQTQDSETIRKLLSPDARIIETADVTGVIGKPRMLVLWMQHPRKIVRRPDAPYCGDFVYGDYWLGPTGLSLVDQVQLKLVNTVNINGAGIIGDPTDSFRLPYRVTGEHYDVPVRNANGEGVPHIMNLHDLTGDGLAAEFVLFAHGACNVPSTSVWGYNPQSDQAVNFPIQVVRNGKMLPPTVWIDQVFARKPIRPGHWKFTWNLAHGTDEVYHEDVSFDPAKQIFMDKQTITHEQPNPARQGKP